MDRSAMSSPLVRVGSVHIYLQSVRGGSCLHLDSLQFSSRSSILILTPRFRGSIAVLLRPLRYPQIKGALLLSVDYGTVPSQRGLQPFN